MMTCSGISFTGITTGIPITGISHTPIIMIPGTMTDGITIPGTAPITMVTTTTDTMLPIIHAIIQYTFPVHPELNTTHLTAVSTTADGTAT